jgi:NAD+ diphosphatase
MPVSTDSLGFISNVLSRHTAERDHGALERALVDPEALTVLIAGDTPILRTGGESATAFLPASDLARLSVHEEQIFLGTRDRTPVIGTLAPAEAVELFTDDPAFRVVDLRSVAVQGLVSAEELGALAMAKSLLFWHQRHRFCPNCGAPTALSAAGFRRDCPSCKAQHFPRTDPVVIMLVTRGDKCLLGRQARFVAGSYSALAGFLEPGETIEDAVRREVFEEAGVRVGYVRYLASQPWPFPSSLMIGCHAEGLTGDIVRDEDELEDARWFSRDEVRSMLDRRHPEGLITPPPMAIANFLIRSFVEGA